MVVVFPRSALAAEWTFPMADYHNRQTQKGYAQYLDKQWYQGKEKLYPNQFTGFHTGVDLEIFPDETDKPVPVYAVTSGRVDFSGSISGYGGVVLFRAESDPVTFLYGHVKLDGVKTGANYTGGQILTYLGDGFSSQTGGERKHLHFAVYRGSDNYFRGYESSLSALNSKFLDPNQYLDTRISPTPIPNLSPTSTSPTFTVSTPSPTPSSPSLFSRIIHWILSLFQ